MAGWQYRGSAPSTSEGYAVSTPAPRKLASETQNTAVITDQDGQKFYIYLHQIDVSFSINGETVQTMRRKWFYPRHMVAPSFSVTGQCASQEEYQNLCEFIRKTQDKSLAWQTSDPGIAHTVQLHIAEGGKGNHRHEGYHLRGHIKNIKRVSERFVFAPEFQFDFLVFTSTTGMFNDKSEESSVKKDLSEWMDVFKGPWQTDPDNATNQAKISERQETP